MTTHSYDNYRNDRSSSEYVHLQELNHFMTPISFEVFKKTEAEKQELKTRMYNYPNKNHRPVQPNN